MNEFELVKIRDIINVVQFTTLKTTEEEIPTVKGDDEMLDEQAHHKQLLAQVVTGESRISMADYSIVRERILDQEQALIRLLNFQFSPRKGEAAISRVLFWGQELNLRPHHIQVVLALLNDR